MSSRERFHVITGGPGSGKTTLIEALARLGYAHTVEAGRAIIQDQLAIDGPALPARDPFAFTELMLSWELRSYRMAETTAGPVFFDRGVTDLVGYLTLIGQPVRLTSRGRPSASATIAASSSPRPGLRSIRRTPSANRRPRKRCAPTRRWSPPILTAATSR